MTPRLGAVLATLPLVSLLGCGASRGEPPPLDRPEKPAEYRKVVLAENNVVVDAPTNWELIRRVAPGAGTVATGGASLSIWAYPAQSPVATEADLTDAAARIEESLAKREPGLRVTKVTTMTVAGFPAVELQTSGELFGMRVKGRSVHVYVGTAEYVIDAVAERDAFKRADPAFRHMIKTMGLGFTPPLAKAEKSEPEGAAPGPTPEEG